MNTKAKIKLLAKAILEINSNIYPTEQINLQTVKKLKKLLE